MPWGCSGNFCPEDLSLINTPGFTIRAGIIPYTAEGGGRVLLGVKDGLYGDFGGGCKMKKGEKPFQCAHREFTEETLGMLSLDRKNITHVFVSGTKQPHQTILFVRVDSFDPTLPDKYFQAPGPKELGAIRYATFSDFNRFPPSYFDVNMKKILPEIKRAMNDVRR